LFGILSTATPYKNEMGEACGMVCTGKNSTSYNILVGKSEGKTPLTRPRHRWENNLKIKLEETGWVWTGFIWLRTGTSGRLL
jgi:hypothetical protein